MQIAATMPTWLNSGLLLRKATKKQPKLPIFDNTVLRLGDHTGLSLFQEKAVEHRKRMSN